MTKEWCRLKFYGVRDGEQCKMRPEHEVQLLGVLSGKGQEGRGEQLWTRNLE